MSARQLRRIVHAAAQATGITKRACRTHTLPLRIASPPICSNRTSTSALSRRSARARQARDDSALYPRRRQHDPRRLTSPLGPGLGVNLARRPPPASTGGAAPGHSPEVADIFRTRGAAWCRANAGQRQPRPVEGHVGDRDLPHRGASAVTSSAATTAPMLRSPTTLKPELLLSLPEVPRRGGETMAGSPARRSGCRSPTTSPRLHPAGPDRANRVSTTRPSSTTRGCSGPPPRR